MRAPDSLIFLRRQAACLALLAPFAALAQGPASVRDAANPEAPGAPLVHTGMKPFPLRNDAPSPNAWREAHDAVAAFPRGHADILAWEKQTAAHPTPASAPQSGHGTHHMHMHEGKP